ncbi:hypothetical protein ARALYDRAFT_890958 [Arabidopsis lyrata subsp. lyrata]|uniref:Uncharacterized protein n=1 Tax=Arabidopsis lyrata subsp. lyrata TaxID=81972 RepID=D7KJ99_ARALL|nr:hypothetical protein ARALYDRAFT_913965 [Arabidopsis lyrata subsp. lyrata]EFH70040.1 hypothetical protein ARALYDRAFT_890958 [Arabidopsis lyrata subsp. lyrata]
MKWKLKSISSKSEEQPTLFTSGDRSCYRLSSPPTLVVEGVNIILSRIMYLVAPSTRSSHSRPRLSIRLTSRTRKMAKAYNGQDVNGTA